MTKPVETRYSKASILDSKKFKKRVDLLDILLEDRKKYSIKEVETILNRELNRKL